MRHVLLRGRFCSRSCAEENRKNNSRMRDWLRRHRADDQTCVAGLNTNLKFNTIPNGITKLQEGRVDSPLYFISADLSVFLIAQMMGSDRAIFGVKSPWPSAWREAALHFRTSDMPSVEQLVSPDVALISGHARSSDRCALAGFSFGGVLAFEAAHQLRAQGVNVEIVMLLDAAATYRPPHEILWRNLRQDWTRTSSQSTISRLESSLSLTRTMLVKQVKRLGRDFLRVVLRDLDELTERSDDTGVFLHWGLLERMYLHAVQSYCLRPLDCRGILFRADEPSEKATRALDGSLGWNNLFKRGLEIIETPGNHFAMMRREYNRVLAEGMKQALN